ncbi:MAG: hypothetical protein FWG40_05525 [Peptococcaceae bacterium]|nr:hypothetical protein [Peptococcaceae bacterium]
MMNSDDIPGTHSKRPEQMPVEQVLLEDLMQDVRQYDDDWFAVLAVEDMKSFLDTCYIEKQKGDGV